VAWILSIASGTVLAACLLAGCGGDTTTVVEQTTTTVVDSSSTTDSVSTTNQTTTATSTDNAGGTGAAQSLKAFQSPTGNIACLMTQKLARCDIADRDWKPPPHPSSCPDEVDYGQGIQLPATGAAEFRLRRRHGAQPSGAEARLRQLLAGRLDHVHLGRVGDQLL
jgi:hypothetical protein